MAKRIDENQRLIVEGLRAIGASVQVLSAVGHGCPDVLVGYRGHNFPMEIKVGNARLTPAEQEWRNAWQGTHYIVRSLDEAIAILNFHAGGT